MYVRDVGEQPGPHLFQVSFLFFVFCYPFLANDIGWSALVSRRKATRNKQ